MKKNELIKVSEKMIRDELRKGETAFWDIFSVIQNAAR